MLKINCGQSIVTGVLDLDQTQGEGLCLDPSKTGRKCHIGHCSTLYHFSFVCGKYCPTMT